MYSHSAEWLYAACAGKATYLMKIKSSELKGFALNWVVAKSEGKVDNPESWLYQAKETDTEH